MKPAGNALQQTECGVSGCGRLTAIVLTVAALIFSACGEKPQQPPVPQTAPSQEIAPSQEPAPSQNAPEKLFQQERTMLEKSKGVDQTTEKSSEELRQEVERQAQ